LQRYSTEHRAKMPAKIGGMNRQMLQDWAIRFNEEGPEGLANKPSPGASGKLDEGTRHSVRIVEEGPDPGDSWRGPLAGL
jgi:hypothetical protein